MPEPPPALLSCLWSTKAQRWACIDLFWARQCSSVSWPRGQRRRWGRSCSDDSGSAHFQLISQGERARLWALQKMDTDPLASWGLVFSPVKHLSGCNVNPSPALSSPFCTMEPFHPWVVPAKLAYAVGETPVLVPQYRGNFLGSWWKQEWWPLRFFTPSGKKILSAPHSGTSGVSTAFAFLHDAFIFSQYCRFLMLWGSSCAGDATDDTPAKLCWEPTGFPARGSENQLLWA